jgi:hypothetical protein
MYFLYLLPTFYVFGPGINGVNPINRNAAGAPCHHAPEALAPATWVLSRSRPRLEETMNKQSLRAPLAIAALTLALSAAPAFAQRAANDGGALYSPPPSASQSQPATSTATATLPSARGTNDGGTLATPSAAQVQSTKTSSKTTAASPAPAPLGRAANDGGTLQ